MNLHSVLKDLISPTPMPAEQGAMAIRNLLANNTPAMVARFGSVEIKGVLYPRMPWPIRKWMKPSVFFSMENNAGFFPVTDSALAEFSRLMGDDMKLLDILGSWRVEEEFLKKNFPSAVRIELKGLEPYLSAHPWTEVLQGKKVVVVHPFNNTIERQYHENASRLFADQRVLPKFASLETIKAVQTIAGNPSHFPEWFAALDSMKSALDAKIYDVAIIGCGAYGFPLAAHVKRSGKQAVHLGGATQILFGIRGRRWDSHPVISRFYNEYWTRPDAEDIPRNASKVENACYW